MKLTGRQRYRQAILKQKLVFAKQHRELTRGNRNAISCPLDQFIVAEFERAFDAGYAAGRAALKEARNGE